MSSVAEQGNDGVTSRANVCRKYLDGAAMEDFPKNNTRKAVRR